MPRYSVTVILSLVIIQSSVQLPLINKVKDCYTKELEEVARAFITISSIYISTTDSGVVTRHLELNWFGFDSEPGDEVSLYSEDPNSSPKPESLFSVDPLNYPGGYVRSDVEMPVQFFNLSNLAGDPCLGYWTAYRNASGSILSTTCLQLQPHWMNNNREYLNDLKMSQIMIPGSHDSGSFYFHREMAPLSKYKYAQEEPIFNQLVYGLRYFDLRVGYYKNSEDKFYINHNFLKTEHSVRSVLLQVKKFIVLTREIVILDFHNFPIGFTNDLIHFKLISLITHTFGPYLIPHGHRFQHATMNQLWKHDKRVLISYDSKIRDLFYQKTLWPRIPRAWGNKQEPQDLKQYFQEVFDNPVPAGIWASMAELTPNAKTIVLHPATGLRYYADKINRNVTHWFRDYYWQKANIVATDYFLGNDIIDVAIRTNQIKGRCPHSSWSHKNHADSELDTNHISNE